MVCFPLIILFERSFPEFELWYIFIRVSVHLRWLLQNRAWKRRKSTRVRTVVWCLSKFSKIYSLKMKLYSEIMELWLQCDCGSASSFACDRSNFCFLVARFEFARLRNGAGVLPTSHLVNKNLKCVNLQPIRLPVHRLSQGVANKGRNSFPEDFVWRGPDLT